MASCKILIISAFLIVLNLFITGCSSSDSSTPMSGDASLSAVITDFDLDQIFQSTLTEYTATVGFLQSTASIQAITTASNATLTLNGNHVQNDSIQTISLNEGENPITLVVTAQDGNQQTYSLTLTRESFLTLAQQGYLKASNAGSGDELGRAIAISGDTLVVGVSSEDGDSNSTWATPNNNASNAGAVYVFIRNGTTWTQQAYLKASNIEAGDGFGSIVAISGDTLVVGAVGEDGDSNSTSTVSNNNVNNAGAVYVFTRNGTTWTQEAYIKAGNAGDSDNFGVSIAIDGDTLAVGANWEDGNINSTVDNPNDFATSSGAVYVFTRSGVTWTHQAYLKASNADNLDYFGEDIGLSGDTIVVGAWREAGDANSTFETPNNNGHQTGAAYVFVRNGSSWAQQAYLKASNADDLDYFGDSVAVSGNTIAVGSWGEDGDVNSTASSPNDNAISTGAVYVFERSGTTWTQQAYLKAHNAQNSDILGTSVAISGDTLAVSAIGEDGDANSIVTDTNNNESGAGAVYIYTRKNTTWSQMSYRKASNAGSLDEFGRSLAIDGDTLVVGAQGEDGDLNSTFSLPNDNMSTAGAVYVVK